MPEIHDPRKESGENRRFINEKIIKPSITKGQIAKYVFALFVAAILFGIVAAVSFAVSKPWALRYLGDEPAQEPSIAIPKDEPAETTVEASEETEEQESEPIEDKVQSVLERYEYSVDDLDSMLNSLRAQAQKADKGVVVVHSVQQEMDWFDNPVETTGLYAGVVIANTSQELLILTPEEAVEKADSIKVIFSDGSEMDGGMKQKDTASGMAIVSVSTGDMKEGTLKSVEMLPLGNSYSVREGDLVIAVGSPAGVVHSIDYGFISYILKNVPMVDQVGRVLYSGISANVERGTFLVNTSGELIGWAMEPYQGDGESHAAEIMGISDYKGILEKLTNGLGAPYFGIVGQEVSETTAPEGLPKGVYVTTAVADGPAYNAGIQNGDIITRVDGKKILSMQDFRNMMEDMECGQLIDVTVRRNGRDQYTELKFQVTIGAR